MTEARTDDLRRWLQRRLDAKRSVRFPRINKPPRMRTRAVPHAIDSSGNSSGHDALELAADESPECGVDQSRNQHHQASRQYGGDGERRP